MNIVQAPSTVVVPAGRVCPRCGAPLGGFGPEGLCGACMFDVALTTDEPAPAQGQFPSVSRRFGDYELLEEIARGGMGVVFKARQLSLNRVVAVKMILRGEFAGVAELARFRAEAETAARLQHPNIVAIHEVGEQDGQPFFSMDYVEGQNLAQLVGNTPLPAARAAKYLKTITEAIQYAHQQGVLHRDLKPSNVLIDASDQPRVTDFGLAKRLEGDASLTVTGQVLGSPNFMPPEQAAGKNDAIGAASDVYSLGAILYHALTGRPPFAAESVTATLRLVAESEAVPPRLLNGSVPRDLETVCLKCLQKEPRRRYASALELVEELGRFLRDEPIRARPASRVEKVWRWSRRNRALATAGAAVLALLLVVAIGSPIAALRINRERLQAEAARQQAQADKKKAETEASKSQQVAQFLKDLLKGVGPLAAKGRDTALLRDILNRTMERVGRDLTNQPDVEAELRMTVGGVYLDMGDYTDAEVAFRYALDLNRRLFGETNANTVNSMNALATVLQRAHKTAESEVLYRQALAIRRQLFGDDDMSVTDSMWGLSDILDRQGKPKEAEALLQEALRIQKKLRGEEGISVATTYMRLSRFSSFFGRHAEAEAMAREGLRIKAKRLAPNNPFLAEAHSYVGLELEAQGKFEEAAKSFQDALTIFRKFGTNNLTLEFSTALYHLARVLDGQGKASEAEPVYKEVLAIRRKSFGDEHLWTTGIIYDLAALLRKKGELAEAEPLLRECLAVDRKRNAGKPFGLVTSLRNLADCMMGLGKTSEATALYRELIEACLPAAERGESRALNQIAWLLATCNDPGTRDGQRAVAYAQKAVDATGRKDAGVLDTLAAAQAEAGNFAEAVKVQQEAIALLPEGKMKTDLTTRLRLYEANTPYRQP